MSERLPMVSESFPVIVDCNKSPAQMIAAGNYDWVDDCIMKPHFSFEGNGQVELNIKLIHYGKFMLSSDVVKDMEIRGLRLVTLPGFLSFGEKYSDKQREFPIVCLGSVWHLDRGYYVAYLCSDDFKRELRLHVWGGGWSEDYRFAAVHK